MMSILIAMNITMSSIFILMKHPLSTGLVLLLQTILISLTTGFMNQNMWFSYILFLIMIGGMLILFMYMTSVASNEKFKMNMKIIFIMTPLPLLVWAIENTNKPMINNEILKSDQNLSFTMMINKFINFPMSMSLTFMMIYLLLALIATVKITNFKQGSIRQMN